MSDDTLRRAKEQIQTLALILPALMLADRHYHNSTKPVKE